MVLHFEGKYAQPSRSFSIDNGLHIPFQAGTWNVIIENKKHFSAYLNIKCGQNINTSQKHANWWILLLFVWKTEEWEWYTVV